MKQVAGVDYVAVFVGTAALTLFLTPCALWVALRRGVLDHPNEIKSQRSAVPYLGGAAILVSFTVVVLAAAFIDPPASGVDQLGIILGLAVALAVLGLIDDLRGL